MEVRRCLTTKWYNLTTVYLDNKLYAIARNHKQAKKAFTILVRESLQDHVDAELISNYITCISVEAINCLQTHLDNWSFDKEFQILLPEHKVEWGRLCDDVRKKYQNNPEFQLGVDGEELHWDWAFPKVPIPKELLDFLEIEERDSRDILLYPLKDD